MKTVLFSSLPIDSEFMWGAWDEKDMHWARKRSSKTADYRVRRNGELSDHMDWAYFGKNDFVYIAHQS